MLTSVGTLFGVSGVVCGSLGAVFRGAGGVFGGTGEVCRDEGAVFGGVVMEFREAGMWFVWGQRERHSGVARRRAGDPTVLERRLKARGCSVWRGGYRCSEAWVQRLAGMREVFGNTGAVLGVNGMRFGGT